MNFNVAKKKKQLFLNIHKLCKIIELVTLAKLSKLKRKIDLIFFYLLISIFLLKKLLQSNYKNYRHLFMPVNSDKSCTGIVFTSL